MEEALANIRSPSTWDKLVVKAFQYFRQVAELHRGFLGQLPTLSRSQYICWAQFHMKVVLEMEKIYGDYLALSPQAVRFFNLVYLQGVALRDAFKRRVLLSEATKCLFRPWYHLQAYTKTVMKLCGIDHHFVQAGTATVKLHNEAGARMFQSMAGFKDTTVPDSFVFTPLQALFGSLTENTTRQQLIADIIEHEAWYVTKLRSIHEVFYIIIFCCMSNTGCHSTSHSSNPSNKQTLLSFPWKICPLSFCPPWMGILKFSWRTKQS